MLSSSGARIVRRFISFLVVLLPPSLLLRCGGDRRTSTCRAVAVAAAAASAAPASFDCKVRKLAYEFGKRLLPRKKKKRRRRGGGGGGNVGRRGGVKNGVDFWELHEALGLNVECLDGGDDDKEEAEVEGQIMAMPGDPQITKQSRRTKARRKRKGLQLQHGGGDNDDDDVDVDGGHHAEASKGSDQNFTSPAPLLSSLLPHSSSQDDDDDAGPIFVYVDAVRGCDDGGGGGGTAETVSPPIGSSARVLPFRSIQAAADYAATLTSLSKPVVVVLLRGGDKTTTASTYYLSEPLVLNSTHSGLSFRAENDDDSDEKPIISGGIELEITEWRPYKVDGGTNRTSAKRKNNIWVTNIRGQVDGGDDGDGMPGLQMNGKRCTRARYPNLEPGGIEVTCGYGCVISGNDGNWTPPEFRHRKVTNVTYYTDNDARHVRENGGWFEHYTVGIGGACSVYDPPVSYWCSEHPAGGGAFAFRTPSGVAFSPHLLPNAPYASPSSVLDAVMFVWRPARWANWMFEVEAYDPVANNFTFGRGGNQGARGENYGGDFFIENVLEELDYPNEFYYNKRTGDLYLFHNGTGPPPPDASFVVPMSRTLVNISGTQWDPVQNVSFRGIEFRSTRYTYMDAHGVPSAGDWALERNAAVFLQGTEHVTFDECAFDRLDGNGLMVSGYNRHTTISNSDFTYIGGTAIVAWGYTNETATDPGRPGVVAENWPAAGVYGTDGEHPRYTVVRGCVAREVGLYEKQSSFFMQAKTALSTIVGNVFFNGPRAGINFNDGFGGGDVVAWNLVFSTCRESGDHGPFNSWDRQPYLTNVRDVGAPSTIMQWRNLHHNFLIDNYSPQENVDNDDGSAYYHTHDNFLVYGSSAMKNDFGGHDNHHYGNIYAYVGKSPLNLCDALEGHEGRFFRNKVVMAAATDLGKFQCNSTVVYGNNYYTPTGTMTECGMPLEDWQKRGHDVNSTVSKLPNDDTVLDWARNLLLL